MGNTNQGLEEIVSFVSTSKTNPAVTGVRVYLEYPLHGETRHSGYFGMVEPTLRCQAINDEGKVLGHHEEHLERYAPIETRIDPQKIERIKQVLGQRGRRIAGYASSQGLKVVFYVQNPPQIEICENNGNK